MTDFSQFTTFPLVVNNVFNPISDLQLSKSEIISMLPIFKLFSPSNKQ